MNDDSILIAVILVAPVLGVVVAYLLGQLSSVWQQQKNHTERTVIAEYEAPKLISPAELGYIVDAKFGSNELLATIADLYAKGLVRLRPLADDDFSITAIDTKGSADDSESSVLGYLRSNPESAITWRHFDSLLSNSVGAQADFKDGVLGSLMSKDLLDRGAFGGIFQRDKQGPIIVATVLTLACFWTVSRWLKIYNHTGTSTGFIAVDNGVLRILFVLLLMPGWFLLLAYVNLLVKIFTHRDGIPFGATKLFRSLWPEVAGFQLFLKETEYVRLQHDRNPRDPAMAYCLALGLDPGFIQSLHKQ